MGRVAVVCVTTLLLRSHASGLILHRGRYGNQFEGLSQQDAGVSQSHNPGPANPRTQQGKRSKGRHGDKRARYAGGGVTETGLTFISPSITSVDLLSQYNQCLCSSRPVAPVPPTSVLYSTVTGDQSQPIIISDTPSPTVSIITIHSDSEDDADRKSSVPW